MKPEEVIPALKSIQALYQQIEQIRQERIDAEKAISLEYKVDECNEKRQVSANSFQDQIILLEFQIKAIEEEIKEAIA